MGLLLREYVYCTIHLVKVAQWLDIVVRAFTVIQTECA
jgi:hypothetical protein